MTLVFVDTETFGLELHHDIWELAWAVDDGPIQSAIVPHSTVNADPKALELNGYAKRGYGRTPSTAADWNLRAALEGNVLVAANPTFDATRLQLRWGCAPWFYRVLDVSAMSVPLFGLNASGVPMGLWELSNMLREFGVDVPEPDHTAAADVACLRAAYHGLIKISAGVERA